jgi:peptidoglycan/xylan/chitin deacetylase (PgdA/CDA1 family)
MKVRVRLACLGLVGALAVLPGCGLFPRPPRAVVVPAAPSIPSTPVFESDEFVVTFARDGDTAEGLAARFLGDAGKAWMIEDYNRTKLLAPGQEVVIPKQAWNPVGVEPQGYQLVPVLVYHNIGPETKGRLVIGVRTFEEQMRYLKARGYRVVSLSELHEFFGGRRQLPRNAVALSFDDGYRSFLQYAYPVLKELDFRATLFVYTDYVGAGRNALSWPELAQLAREGFDIEGHSKTHGDLRHRRDESAADYGRRMQVELGEPLVLFERHLGRRPDLLAYPYGYYDEDLLQKVREFGYAGAYTVRRDGNPAFVGPYRARRSQIYGDMTLEEFGRILGVYSAEPTR